MNRSIKDLSTCFLTYHTLSSSFQGAVSLPSRGCVYFIPYIHFYSPPFVIFGVIVTDVEKEKKERISVGAFGMATYKTQGRLWDNDRLLSLLSVADSWLKQLRVHHHDFTYFTTTPYHL